MVIYINDDNGDKITKQVLEWDSNLGHVPFEYESKPCNNFLRIHNMFRSEQRSQNLRKTQDGPAF